MARIGPARLPHGGAVSTPHVDVELLDDLGGVVHVPTGEAQASVDDLLTSIRFGVRLRHRQSDGDATGWGTREPRARVGAL